MNTTNKQIKAAIRTKYAWPGGYEIFLFTADGGLLCTPCARTEYKQIVYSRMHGTRSDGWYVDGIDATCNTDYDVICDHCNRNLNSEE